MARIAGGYQLARRLVPTNALVLTGLANFRVGSETLRKRIFRDLLWTLRPRMRKGQAQWKCASSPSVPFEISY